MIDEDWITIPTGNYKPELEKWDLTELETFFKTVKQWPENIKLDACSTVTDIEKFVKNHLTIVRASNGKESFKHYLGRLELVRDKLNGHGNGHEVANKNTTN